MNVFFVNNGTPHYFNLVLNKLASVPGLQLTVVVPRERSGAIGEGVFQTREGLNAPVVQLEEFSLAGRLRGLKGLMGLLLRRRPQIVILPDCYLMSFALNPAMMLLVRILRIRLIMKSIPFRIPTLHDRMSSQHHLGLVRWLRSGFGLMVRRYAYGVPDAHVNYTDSAFAVYGSYGVPMRRIFVTGNSPDTDSLLEISQSVKGLLPLCSHRIIHVGRLVAWKRVDMLIGAFARVMERFPDAELLIVGDGPERTGLEAQTAQLGLTQSVRFKGGVYDPRELGGYLLSSTVYVLAGMGGLSIN